VPLAREEPLYVESAPPSAKRGAFALEIATGGKPICRGIEFWHPTSSSIALVASWIIFMSSEEPRKQPWLARLGRSPLVLGWKAASLTSGKYALAVRVPTSLTVALGCDEQVRAHCV
jgi:hypothetical protein